MGSALVSLQSSGLTGAGKDDWALSIVPVPMKAKKGSNVVTLVMLFWILEVCLLFAQRL